jgi:uncharacterized protein YdeI (YjbR/CyaY-like superfamily)
MNTLNSKVDFYFDHSEKWKKELEQLRRIVLDSGLTEELKWGSPCYTFEKSNVVLIGEYKECCVLSFLKGVLLSDIENILSKPGENSQSARVVRFTSVEEIIALENSLKTYLFEAIEIEKAGLKVEFKEKSELVLIPELQDFFEENPAFKTAFEALTPGKQRGYHLHFSESKQSQTRKTRIEKYIPQILNGKGIHDCTCGLSQKMPRCDGSHKQLR